MEQAEIGYFSIDPIGDSSIIRYCKEPIIEGDLKDAVFVDTAAIGDTLELADNFNGYPTCFKAAVTEEGIRVDVYIPALKKHYDIILDDIVRKAKFNYLIEVKDLNYFDSIERLVVLATVFAIDETGDFHEQQTLLIGVNPVEDPNPDWQIYIDDVALDTICCESKGSLIFVAGSDVDTMPAVYVVDTSSCSSNSRFISSASGDGDIVAVLPIEIPSCDIGSVNDVIYSKELDKIAMAATIETFFGDDDATKSLGISIFDIRKQKTETYVLTEYELERTGLCLESSLVLDIDKNNLLLVDEQGNAKTVAVLD